MIVFKFQPSLEKVASFVVVILSAMSAAVVRGGSDCLSTVTGVVRGGSD